VAEWMRLYRRFWDERYQRLDDYLRELRAEDTAKEKHDERED
jgi:hypothetical protein